MIDRIHSGIGDVDRIRRRVEAHRGRTRQQRRLQHLARDQRGADVERVHRLVAVQRIARGSARVQGQVVRIHSQRCRHQHRVAGEVHHRQQSVRCGARAGHRNRILDRLCRRPHHADRALHGTVCVPAPCDHRQRYSQPRRQRSAPRRRRWAPRPMNPAPPSNSCQLHFHSMQTFSHVPADADCAQASIVNQPGPLRASRHQIHPARLQLTTCN